ncbi:hypothetical protein FRC20_004778 [Serendipita sp. 405]|nr:hypothetical protein FRC20_004778 [Serendipita sp. 405]
MTERNYLSALYINACLERSGDTSLDVILDYTRFPEPYQFMRTYIYNLVRCSTEDKQVKQDILSHLAGEFYDNDRVSGWDYPFYDRKLKPLLDIVRSLVGPEGVHVRRWKTAVIILGGTDSVDEAMWGIIDVEMPNLVSLHISQFDHSIWDRPSLWPALRELTTSAMIAIRHVPIDFNALTSFEFCHFNYQEYSSNFATLSQCVALRKLTIKCDGRPIDNAPQIEVELPMLVSLTLEGKVDLIDYVRFISPKLEHWILDCEPCNKFPDVDAAYVEWYCRKVWRGNTPGAERSCLLQVLSTFKRTTSFTAVELEHAELCFDTICALAEAKTLPACLGLIEIDGAGSLNLAGSR